MNFKLKPFPEDGKFWRVDWLGAVSPNPSVDSEPRIDVHLTRLKDDYVDSAKNSSLILDEQKTIPVGLGALPFLSKGSVWKDKKCHEIPVQGKSLTFQLDTANLLASTFDGQYQNDQGTFRYIGGYYPVKTHYRTVKDAPIYIAPVTEPKSSLKFILIPQIELFRFYYVCSSLIAKCIWNDDLSRAINQEKTNLLEGNDLRIYLRKNLYDHEGWLLGRWFLSGTMRDQISKMVRKYRIDTINAPHGKRVLVHPQIGFPFTGKTTLTVVGKRIKMAEWKDDLGHTHQEWSFLVQRIQCCTHPLPFRDIILDRENNSLRAPNQDDPDLEPAWSPDITPIAEPDSASVDELDITSTEEPDRKLRRSMLELFQQRFSDLSGKTIIKEPKTVQRYKNKLIIQSGTSIINSLGTGDGTSTDTEVGPANVAINPPTDVKLPADLNTFIEALKFLREQEEIEGIETLEIGGVGIPVGGEIIYRYPSKIKKVRSWHIISDEPIKTRSVIVARVELHGQTTYLLEIERKSDKHSTLVLRSENRDAVSDTTLNRFLLETARDNGWPNHLKFPGLLWEGVNHHEADSIERYGRRILKKLIA